MCKLGSVNLLKLMSHIWLCESSTTVEWRKTDLRFQRDRKRIKKCFIVHLRDKETMVNLINQVFYLSRHLDYFWWMEDLFWLGKERACPWLCEPFYRVRKQWGKNCIHSKYQMNCHYFSVIMENSGGLVSLVMVYVI